MPICISFVVVVIHGKLLYCKINFYFLNFSNPFAMLNIPQIRKSKYILQVLVEHHIKKTLHLCHCCLNYLKECKQCTHSHDVCYFVIWGELESGVGGLDRESTVC